MRTRRNVDKTAERPLTAAEKRRIVKLHDVPFTPVEISRELDIPVNIVRQVLKEMCPVDVTYA